MNISITKGKTYSEVLRWEQETYVYVPITAISKVNGSPAITATAHGAPDGWRVVVTGVKGMTDINCQNWPPKDSDWKKATKIDANTVELNSLNAADFKDYTSGGFLIYRAPVDLTGFTARMTIKDKVGGTVLETLTTAGGEIVINTTDYTITRTLDAATTAAYTFKKGVYDMEMVSPDATPVVSEYDSGAVVVEEEVTT